MSQPVRLCPNCNKIVKGHPNKVYCNSRCKDKYHNTHNPRGYFAHLAHSNREVDHDDDPSWDAHK